MPRFPGSNPHSNTVPGIEGWISDQGVIERRHRVGIQCLHHVFSPRWGCGPAGARAVSRSCGENAQTHGSRGGWGGPSATYETGVTDCTAGSCSSGRDEWDPLSARPAGRERPPRNWPSRAQTGLSERSLPGSFLAGRRQAAASFREVRCTCGRIDRTPFRGAGLGLRCDDDAYLRVGESTTHRRSDRRSPFPHRSR